MRTWLEVASVGAGSTPGPERSTQRLQYPLMKEYTLKYNRNPNTLLRYIP